jgi:hypothetical protein
MVASEILILFVKVRVLISHQTITMTDAMVYARYNQAKILFSKPKVKKNNKRKYLIIDETKKKAGRVHIVCR